MIIIRFIQTLFWWFLISFLYLVFTTFILPVSFLLKKPELIFYRAARFWARLAVFFSFISVKVQGLENTPRSGPLIIASNHQSLMDIFLLLAYFPRRFRFVVKKELFKVPFLGWYMKKAGYLSIDRQVAVRAHHTLEKIKDLLEKGEAILFFPEGTRSPDGILKDFKRGGFDLALSTGTPIMPVSIKGTYRIVPKGGILFHPCPVSMTAGELIPVEKIPDPSKKDGEILIERVRNSIQTLQA